MSLIDAFHQLAKINKIDLTRKAYFNPLDRRDQESLRLMAKNLSLKDTISLSLTSKKMRELMKPIIQQKERELESLRKWLSVLRVPINYTIHQLDQLERLDLDNNQLTSLPELNLPNLQSLSLSNNQLTNLPDLNLPNLQRLDLDNNQLTELNLNLYNLQRLDLDNNQLTNLNLNITNIDELYIKNNPLTEESKDYLKSLNIKNLYL